MQIWINSKMIEISCEGNSAFTDIIVTAHLMPAFIFLYLKIQYLQYINQF